MRRFVVAFLPVLAALALCPVGALLAPGDPAGPIARARDLLDLEHALGLQVQVDKAGGLLGFIYLFVHLPAAIGALVWLYLERPRAFPRFRDAFVVTATTVLVVNWVVPTAPPWMLAPGAEEPAGAAYLLQSPYAAMPSGHVAWAVVAGAAVATQAGPLLVRLLGALYPVAVTALVLATGNHFAVDAVAGALVAGLGFGAAALVRRGVRLTRRSVRATAVPGAPPTR